jgi:serine/threonine-protein kinase
MSQPSIMDRLGAALADRYRIERELGAGGMATVYLAQDLRHDRQVALKVLKPELAAVIGAERFLNEIKVTANLQHPHILPLYDSGEADGLLFYVMPLIEGESLHDRLIRERQLPVEDAVAITSAVAGALDYAHRHDVIHRDIKPENILLHDGQPLVADFGIALAVSEAGGSRLTETGLSLGTPFYMSPEQATGERVIDKRSDVYSLGCVAYEMLAGEPPHTGPTSQAVIAKILTSSPPSLADRRSSVPPHVEAAIEKALEKLPADRYAGADEFAEALARPGAVSALRSKPRTTAATRTSLWTVAAVAALALVIGIAGGRFTSRSSETEARVLRFTIPLGPDHYLMNARVGSIVLAPDGSALAYSANIQGQGALFLRRFEELESVELPGTRGLTPWYPFFSPDGEWIGYQEFYSRELQIVPVTGGSPTRLTGSAARLGGAYGLSSYDWADDGTILLSGDFAGIMALPEAGGELVVVTRPDTTAGVVGHFLPEALPGGEAILVTFTAVGLSSARLGGTGIAVVWPETGEWKVLIASGAAGARYSPTGHIVWAQEDGALMAAPFDLDRLEISGTPVMMAPSILIAGGTGMPSFTLSDDGTLAYIGSLPARVVMVDRAGTPTTVTDEPQAYHSPRLSPDGRKLAVDITAPSGRDIWVYDLEQGTLTRVTFDGTANDPVWAPDGRRVCYGSTMESALRHPYCVNADGSGESELLYEGQHEATVGVWLPDGGAAVLIPFGTAQSYDLQLLTPGSGEIETILATPFTEQYPALSPDGSWLAYVSNESGRAELYARPLQRREGRVQVSQNGASESVWSHDGRELFYIEPTVAGPRLMAARVETSPRFQVLSREPLFATDNYETAGPHANYDVHPDGRRFVMVQRAAASEVIVIKNFHIEVDRAQSR